MTPLTTYAVLLRETGAPHAEAVRRAFGTFSHLTDADAIRLAANAQGILMRHLSVDEAKALQRALVAEGVRAALVKDEELRFLPAAQSLQRLELTHDALVAFDCLGHAETVPWSEISLVAAGSVAHVDIHPFAPPPAPAGRRSLFSLLTRQHLETRSRLETERHLILELIIGNATARYEVQAHQFQFHSVLGQSTASRMEKFVWLVREMTRRAPHALRNRAAQDVHDGVVLLRGYPSHQALLDEMVWLLWNRAQAGPTN